MLLQQLQRRSVYPAFLLVGQKLQHHSGHYSCAPSAMR
jgi:hypothetical protein